MNVLHRSNWTALANAVLADYTAQVHEATKKDGWDGVSDGETVNEHQWSFAGALLFSITVVTTIGRQTIYIYAANQYCLCDHAYT